MVCIVLKDKYPYFEVRLKWVLMVFSYLLLCSYMNKMRLKQRPPMNVSQCDVIRSYHLTVNNVMALRSTCNK